MSIYITNITLKVCSNADAVVMELLGGSIDMYCRITSSQAAELAGSQYQVLEGTMNLVQAMYLNNAVEPFDDVRVRQALCYAISPQEIMTIISDGKGTEVGSSMYPAFGKYFMPELNDTYNQDIEKVRSVILETVKANNLILSDPEPIIAVKEHGQSSINFACLIWCESDDYWNVFYYMQEQIKIAFDKNGISIPYNQLDVHVKKD